MCRGTYGVNHKISDDLKTLTVTGMVFDTVRAADMAGETYTVDYSDILVAGTPVDPSEEWDRTHQLERRWRNMAFMDGVPNPYTSLPGGKAEALLRTLMANQVRAVGGDFAEITGAFIQKVDHFFTSEPELTKKKRVTNFDYDIDIMLAYNVFSAQLMRCASWRSFVVTERGFLGLAPRDVRSGDVVCVVRGSQKPLILRPLPHGRYQLVGECYVHGIMDGSFARKQGWGAVEKFCIE